MNPLDIMHVVVGPATEVVGKPVIGPFSLSNVIGILQPFVTGGVFAAILTIAAKWFKDKRDSATENRKIDVGHETALVPMLTARIERLEEKVDQNEAECAERIDLAIKTNDIRWEGRLQEQARNYEGRIAKLEGDLRQILQQGNSAGHVFALGFNAPEAAARAAKGDGE